MATTTNYGWTTPDDTALVKDGAAAIRTLGSSVDTTTKALNPSTTLGDIEYRSSTANTNTRLGIGTTGQVLTVAGGVPSWATAAAPSTAFNKITSASFTTQSSVAVDGCFTSTYRRYVLVYSLIASNSLAELHLQFRYAGPTTQTASYYGSGRVQVRFNTGTNFGFDGTGEGVIAADMGTAQKTFGTINFNNVGNSSQDACYFGAGMEADGNGFSNFAGVTNEARTYTGFLLKPSGGTITGTYAVYGLEN